MQKKNTVSTISKMNSEQQGFWLSSHNVLVMGFQENVSRKRMNFLNHLLVSKSQQIFQSSLYHLHHNIDTSMTTQTYKIQISLHKDKKEKKRKEGKIDKLQKPVRHIYIVKIRYQQQVTRLDPF